MDLILWRHAEAYEAQEGDIDRDRELTSRGQKQAARMANWLERHIPDSCRVLCSPAKRAEQTVMALGRKYKLRAELGPDAAVAPLLELAQWPHSKNCVLVVGHQPVLGQVLAQLLNMDEAHCAPKKGSVWWLRTRLRDGEQRTSIYTVQNPETV